MSPRRPVKTLLIISVLAAVSGRADGRRPGSMRDVLHAKVMAALPAPALAIPPQVQRNDVPLLLRPLAVSGVMPPAEQIGASDGTVITMAPFVVSDLKRDPRLDAAISRQGERPSFSSATGGTLYSSKRLKVGAWWSPTAGWTFLKLRW